MSSSDKVLAGPSAACCLRGTIHTGSPSGAVSEIAGVETYIATPPTGKANGNIVLYFPDVFGLFTNGQLIMDGFAEAGYLVFGPDYFRGDPVTKYRKDFSNPDENPGFDMAAWMQKHQTFSDPFVPKFVEEVKAKYGVEGTKYACVGYCYGAPYVCDQLSDKGICSAGAFAHPAFLKEHHFENLKNPLLLSCSAHDVTFPKESRRRAIDIMDEREHKYQVQIFKGVEHGFALRGDMSDPWQKHCKDQSFEGIVEFFNVHLK